MILFDSSIIGRQYYRSCYNDVIDDNYCGLWDAYRRKESSFTTCTNILHCLRVLDRP